MCHDEMMAKKLDALTGGGNISGIHMKGIGNESKFGKKGA